MNVYLLSPGPDVRLDRACAGGARVTDSPFSTKDDEVFIMNRPFKGEGSSTAQASWGRFRGV